MTLNTVILFLVVAFALNGQANSTNIISSRTVQLPVDLSRSKIVVSNKGYGTTYLVKILVPALTGPTLMNHRNEGESAPCLATFQTNNPEDILDGNPETIIADFKIELVKSVLPDKNSKTCHVYLDENISTIVRGYTFVHNRRSELPMRSIEDCQ